jgi:putative ABC transport system permease protein
MGIGQALTSHYRRHPLQLLALVLVVLLATALWNGVWNLTQQARTSLAQSEQALDTRYQAVRRDGQPVSVEDFAALRRAGVCASPWLVVNPPAPAGRVIGIDAFSLSCFGEAGQPANQSLDGEPFMDIADARELAATSDHTELQLLVSGPDQPVPGAYRIRSVNGALSTGQLADSFLLNLNALCVLVLLITALLIRSVYSLGLNQRRASLALLERFGVSSGQLRLWLAGELLLIALVAVLPGVWLGQALATVLASGFDRALSGLFDVQLLATGSDWSSLLVSVGVMLLAVFWCVADTLVPPLRHWAMKLPVAATGTLLVVAGAITVGFADTLATLFVALAIIFLGTGLVTPRVLATVSARLANRPIDPLRRWQWRELAVMLRQLALPVVALQFALATVIAVQALVTTFESTFQQWLDQRLQGDVYAELPATASRSVTENWLRQQSSLDSWHTVIRGRGQYQGRGVDTLFVDASSPLLESWQFLSAETSPWTLLARPEAAPAMMVNEQFARRTDTQVGDRLTVTIADKIVKRRVVAIYADYGRPSGEMLLPRDGLPSDFQPTFTSFAIRLGTMGREALRAGLTELWQSDGVTLRDNGAIKQLANRVFDQTFLLTRAISALTLALASICLLVMGVVFFNARRWYYQLLTVWGMGRSSVHRILYQQALALTGLIGLAALPLGVGLTWALVDRINPLAFGWTLPMAVYPFFWLQLALVCVIIGSLTGWLMQRQSQARVPPPVDTAHLRSA